MTLNQTPAVTNGRDDRVNGPARKQTALMMQYRDVVAYNAQ